ncbi:toll-like receptor Tollo [Artemia franciscana]|uniref:TIR domain-containing protein n=1 Tax=Artemia franciscana TaxID=6661 RepID=A0AA88L3L9_ARTSF|nr:hypothetical protein QYM36_010174 [Artemia franciscana]
MRAYIIMVMLVTQIVSSVAQECFKKNELTTCHLNSLSPDVIENDQVQDATRLNIECGSSQPIRLDSTSLNSLNNLEDLQIWKCKLDAIQTGSFRYIPNLKSLIIQGTNTEWDDYSLTIGPRVFEDTPNIQHLNLAKNQIYQSQPLLFCPLENLEYLNITHNKWETVGNFGFNSKYTLKGSTEAYPCGEKITVIDLSNNKFKTVPGESLNNLENLKDLYFNDNLIEVLEEYSFSGLKSLRILNLSNNKLSILPPSLLSNTRNLTEIYLQKNKIKVLAPGLLSGLNALIVLDLSYNELTSDWVTVGTFQGLIELRYLSLANNQLRKVDSNLLVDSSQIEFLDFSCNNIEIISNGAFRNMKNLETLLLPHNKLQSLNFDMLKGPSSIKFLSLENNQISRIDPMTLSCCPILDHLVVSKNNLSVFPNVKELQNLKSLDLGYNKISSLRDDALSNISSLETLSLAHNKLKFVTDDSFRDLKHLKVLDLSSNQIEYIETNSFSHIEDLQALRIDNNKLAEVGDILVRSSKFEWLNISANQISHLNFSKLPAKLIWLDAHQNEIRSINYDSYHLDKMKLETLDLSFNLLTEIGPFLPRTLHTLSVNDNKIEKVHPYTFFNMIQLHRVDLYANHIKKLDKDSLRVQPSYPAPEFYIGGNPFECDCNMQWLQTVNTPQPQSTLPKVMDLEGIYCVLTHKRGQVYVPLVEASSHSFLCQYRIHCSTLCHCCEFDACDCEMICPNSCECYHDHAWSRNVADCSSSNLTLVPSGLPIDITDLYLDNNTIPEVGDLAFIGRRNLRSLYLNRSHIETISNRSFVGLRSLLRLHMGDNYLRILGDSLFQELDGLQELHLENNLLEYLSAEVLQPLRSLQYLRLDGNMFTLVSSSVFAFSYKLQMLNISRNPWSCECELLMEFSDWLIKNEKIVVSANTLVCNELEVIMSQNRSCITITSSSKTIIEHNSFMPLLITTLTASAILMTLIIVLYFYRYDIRVWVHSKYGIRLFAKREQTSELYNSFVAYSTKDEPFVIQTLKSNLEYGHGYKLCLQYRDCTPSTVFVSDSVLQGIENSQRIMLILSEHFLSSEWQRLKAVMHHIFKARRRKLIVVIVGDIKMKDLDHDLKLYMKTSAKLVWGESRFWEKLRYELVDVTKRRRCTPSLPIPPVPNEVIDLSHYTAPPL